MAAVMFLALLWQFIIQHPQMVGDEMDEAMQKRMQQREEFLNQEMTRLLEEMEQSPQKLSGPARGALLSAASQQWQFWAFVGGLLLLHWLCWWLCKRSCKPEGSSKHGRRLEEEGEQDPLRKDVLEGTTLWPLPSREGVCMMVEALVNDLLCECRILSGNAFVPQLQPSVGAGGFQEGWSAHGKHFVYILLVPMKPPPGYSFHLERGVGGEMPVRNSRLRVELECTCIRERRLGDTLCFLHHPEDELMRSQGASFLQNFCTGSYLDVEKTALWLQHLMTAASLVVCQEEGSELTVLPSTRFCRLKLTGSNKAPLTIELILAVLESSLHTFVTME